MRLSVIVFLFLLAAVTSSIAKPEGDLVEPSTGQQKSVHSSGVIHTPNSNSGKNGNTQKQEDAIVPAISSNSKLPPGQLDKPIKANYQTIKKRSGADPYSLPPTGTLGKPKIAPGGKSGNSVSANDKKSQKQLKLAQTTISPNLKPATGKSDNPRNTKDEKRPKLLKPSQTTISPNLKPATEKSGNPRNSKDEKSMKQLNPAQTTISPRKPSTVKPRNSKGSEDTQKPEMPAQTTIFPNWKPFIGNSVKPKDPKEEKSGNLTSAKDGRKSGNSASAKVGKAGNSTSAKYRKSGNSSSSNDGKSGNSTSAKDEKSGNSTSAKERKSGNSASAKEGKSGNSTSAKYRKSGNSSSSSNGKSGNSTSAKDGKSGNSTSVKDGKSGNSTSVKEGKSQNSASIKDGKKGNSTSTKDEKSQKQERPAQITVAPNLKPSPVKPSTSNSLQNPWYTKLLNAVLSYIIKFICGQNK